MAENVLTKLSLAISIKSSDDDIIDKIRKSLKDIHALYSYLIYAKYKNNKLVGWLIEYNFSQTDEYNTLDCSIIVDDIIFAILNNRNATQSVIGYKQPSIELMLELYKPLMRKMALEQSEKWTCLDYEDALSLCQYTMIRLYKKGYYIHKRLLYKSFENHILMQLRCEKNKPDIISLDHVVHSDGESGVITLGDVLPDTDAELKAEEELEKEVIDAIFEEVKTMIIDFIGERQFEQLFRDYTNKHTTNWSRKRMQDIKNRFKRLGISWKYFER